MASLLDLLSPYPILETLVSALPLGDLFNLSKTNSLFRAALRGFPIPATVRGQLKGKSRATAEIRPTLQIGEHDTIFWRNLKARSPLLCSEPQHTRGDKIRGCRMCSMPVCEACIIKASFGKRNENTFQSRTRSLCGHCYDTGNPHKLEPLGSEGPTSPPFRSLRRTQWTCLCTAKDGHLCLQCKTEQKQFDIDECFGEGCSDMKAGGFQSRVCLWCDLRLPGERSRAEARRDYDKRHLLARTHSSVERPAEEDDDDDDLEDPSEQRALWDSLLPSASAGQESSTSKVKAPAYDLADDPFERQRREELDAVSTKRQWTAATADDWRWYRAEKLRRPDSMFYPPPPMPVQTFEPDASDTGESLGKALANPTSGEGLSPPAGGLTWHHLDSNASTLQGVNDLPPTYDSVADKANAEMDQKLSNSKI